MMKKVLAIIALVLLTACASTATSGDRAERISGAFKKVHVVVCSLPVEVLILGQVRLVENGVEGIDLIKFCGHNK